VTRDPKWIEKPVGNTKNIARFIGDLNINLDKQIINKIFI